MAVAPLTNSIVFFSPVNIEPESEIPLVKVSVLAKTFFSAPLGDHPYIIEEECFAKCEGDFKNHVFNPSFVGHAPQPLMIRYGEKSIDALSTTLTISKKAPILNGSLVWTIPVYIFDISCNPDGRVKPEKLVLDTTKPIEVEASYIPETNDVDFKKLHEMYLLLARIEVVQSFVLKNGVLTISKNGIDLLTLDLKQYAHIFPRFCFNLAEASEQKIEFSSSASKDVS